MPVDPPTPHSTPHRRRAVGRTGLYEVKPAFVANLRRVEDLAARRGVAANTVTVAGLVVAMATATVLVAGARNPVLWLAVAPLCLFRMACNAIDGSLARRTGTATPRGAVLNELADRAADAATFTALAPAVGWPLALGAAFVALATSYVAVVGEGVLGERFGVGPMGKPDRVAVLSIAAAAAAFTGAAPLVVGAWVLVLGGAVTIGVRARVLWHRAGEAR